MRLKFSSLSLVICVSSGINPALSMGHDYDAIGEYESRKTRGALRYFHQKREKARLGSVEESNSDMDLSVSSTPSLTGYDADIEADPASHPKKKGNQSTTEPLILKINPIDLPKITSRRGKTITLPGDPLEVKITLSNGKTYTCGSEAAEFDISGFEPEGLKKFSRFRVHIKDITRHLTPSAQSFIPLSNEIG